MRPVQTRNVWRPNIIKHCLVTKHTDAEVSGQTVETCLIKHRFNSTSKELWATNYPSSHLAQRRDFNIAECTTSQVAIQKFTLKKGIAAIILLDILEEDGKRENRRGQTRGWIKRREEKEYCNSIVQQLMIEDTPGYREIMRMTHDDFLEMMMLVEPACILLQQISLPFLCFVFLYDSVFLRFQMISPISATFTKASSSFVIFKILNK